MGRTRIAGMKEQKRSRCGAFEKDWPRRLPSLIAAGGAFGAIYVDDNRRSRAFDVLSPKSGGIVLIEPKACNKSFYVLAGINGKKPEGG